MEALLTTYYDYHWEANERYINLIKQTKTPPERAIFLMSHILNAQQIWLNRISPNGKKVGVWEEHAPDSMANLNMEQYKRAITLLAENDLSEIITYQNTQGQTYTNSIRDILLHIVNHGTYHRGQLALLFRAADIAPPNTDYIFYRRE
ncbi:MAG: hypothetical protein DHS20C18_14320 [Saprospiraceae bacterium]|nr:MAG: hypothetical protein DHS20C18_14320 [Saprospiraceae bacterium]